MDECELVILISTIACAIAKCSTDDELTLLAAVFSQLGDTLATIVTSRELKDSSSTDKTNDCNSFKKISDNNLY